MPQVCEITGYCVKNLVFAEDEFVTTVSCLPTQYVAVRRTIEPEQIHNWVWKALASPEARASLVAEGAKRAARAQAIFTRLAKHYKSTRHTINVVGMCAVVAHAMQGSRVPHILPQEELETLANRCSEVIAHFCHRFLDRMHGIMPQVKVHGFVVGVLYLMRTGVVMFESVEVLPRAPELRGALPLESQLQAMLKLSTKIVTECENLIKGTFRNYSRRELVELGFLEH